MANTYHTHRSILLSFLFRSSFFYFFRFFDLSMKFSTVQVQQVLCNYIHPTTVKTNLPKNGTSFATVWFLSVARVAIWKIEEVRLEAHLYFYYQMSLWQKFLTSTVKRKNIAKITRANHFFHNLLLFAYSNEKLLNLIKWRFINFQFFKLSFLLVMQCLNFYTPPVLWMGIVTFQSWLIPWDHSKTPLTALESVFANSANPHNPPQLSLLSPATLASCSLQLRYGTL